MIPGANLLGMALSVMRPQVMPWRAFVSRAENATGDTVATFAAPQDIQGSMQPVDKKLYQELGLNLAKNYSTLYVFGPVQPTARDRDGDLVLFDGKTWQCESDRNWSGVGEYRKVLCVEVPPHE
jgi:hypothetical protein